MESFGDTLALAMIQTHLFYLPPFYKGFIGKSTFIKKKKGKEKQQDSVGQKVDSVIRDPARSWVTVYYSGPFQQSSTC